MTSLLAPHPSSIPPPCPEPDSGNRERGCAADRSPAGLSTCSKSDRLLVGLTISLACLTFPLVWIGGLVTSYDAGMAVPDWPTTFGYNMFLYPWKSWFFGPWDLFVEHGHRLLAALVGLVTLCLTVWVLRRPSLGSLRWGALGLLAFVILQGVLGGLRVVMNSRQIAQFHGIAGPLFFVATVWMALVVCSRRGTLQTISHREPDRLFGFWGATLFVLTAAQLILGSYVRHMDGLTAGTTFQASVTLHTVLGVTLACLSVPFGLQVFLAEQTSRTFRRLALAWSVLVLAQAGLGLGTWLSKYGWPSGWFPDSPLPNWTVQANAFWPSILATAHVAMGALLLAGAFSLFWLARRGWAT